MLVKVYEIGNSRIEIYDDCIVKTEEEKQEILDRLGKMYSSILERKKDKTA